MSPKPLNVELYAIGTEVVYGLTLDTNTHWLAQEVVRLGGDVRRVIKLHDEFDVLVDAFGESVARGADIVISTGGLGPTQDDVTAGVLAQLTDSDLIQPDEVLDDYVERRGLASKDDLNPTLIQMASVPAGADVLINGAGWAPGIRVPVNGTTFIALAGPPREMKSLFTDHVAHYLAELSPTKSASTRRLVSIPAESRIAPYMDAVMEAFPGSYVKARIADRRREGWTAVDVLVTGDGEVEADAMLDRVLEDFGVRLAVDDHTMDAYPEDDAVA
ncbi:competence/damage-inducible protein A [Candidatus Poribacteria bacterium]|jgi:nicotinamide-nucleotide amidase|nr:competence/damage-inducible protein A [Candidatus Poribacteria bacterium]MBT5533822.1 competence/damage-inducible protein A [Candidatus Poribacteria bacterium]MBT7101129.1 competence/damage-inducible protein A [Candidatus Poribacteria bacterium]MBT7805706.1 competence/damage-inducible protein A [Candidatus Poribacteria bacterium]